MSDLDLTVRRNGFGCSELGAVFGVDDDRDLHALYVEKICGVTRAPTESMRWGSRFERPIAEVYEEVMGIPLELLFTKTFRHPQYPHLFGTPDALWRDGRGGMDAKRLNYHQRHRYGPTEEDIPDRVILQMQGLMEILGRQYWDVGVLCDDHFWTYRLERDRDFGAFIGETVEKIWKQYFEGDERPPISGSPISREWLKQKYPTHKWPDIREATDAEIVLLREFGQVRAQQKLLKKRRFELENKILDALKGREGLKWPTGQFRWRRTKDSTWVDWESMAIALRTFYVKDEDARIKLTEDYTHTEPGVRRIWFSSTEDFATGTGEEETNAA